MSTYEPPYDGARAAISDVIDELERLVEEGRRVPFSNRIMVEEDEFRDLVETLRETVPKEILQAQRVVKERERIIDEAQAEAAKIIEASRNRAEYFLSNEGLINEARQRSEEILREAEADRRRLLGETQVIALQQLRIVEESIREGFGTIQGAMRDAVEALDVASDEIRGRTEDLD
jgi:cell division septum initiation protein DivIVA